MTTVSTDRLYVTLLNRMLTYMNANGVSLAQTLGSRIYRHAPPMDAPYPYALYALKRPQSPNGYQELKIVYDFEAIVVNRPRATQPDTEGAADLLAESLRYWSDESNGVLRVTDVVAESLPAFTTPADANVVQVRVTGKVQTFPMFVSAPRM